MSPKRDEFSQLFLSQTRPKSHSRVDHYDLRQAAKFTHDQQKFLQKIFQEFSENTSMDLGTLLQTKVQFNLSQIKLSSHRSYFSSLTDPSCLIEFRIDPETRGVVFVDFSLCFALVDKLLGGRGEAWDQIRYLTEIETAILQPVFLRMLNSYAKGWKDVADIKPQFIKVDFNPLGIQLTPPSDYLVIVNFNAQVAKVTGAIELVVPFRYLKGALPRASFDEFLLTRSIQPAESQTALPVFAKNLEIAKVPVSVELGQSEIPFEELLHIEPGDIIKLETQFTDPLKIKVNDRTKFLGRPGTQEKKIVVQVSKVLTEEDEEFEE